MIDIFAYFFKWSTTTIVIRAIAGTTPKSMGSAGEEYKFSDLGSLITVDMGVRSRSLLSVVVVAVGVRLSRVA